MAFLVFYSIAGVPAGMLVDRLPRLKLLSVAISLWSFVTAFCGIARSFGILFVARAGVGVGEAFMSPAALSLLSDAFPRRRYGFVIGLYVAGGIVGTAFAVGFGGVLYGWLVSMGAVDMPLLGLLRPWQMMFIIVGAPGLLIALSFLFLLEPAHSMRVQPKRGGARIFYREHGGFILCHHLANGFTNLLAIGITSWAASFMIRTYDVGVDVAGPLLGFAFLGGGLAGMIGGGILSDGLTRYGSHFRLWVCVVSAALGTIAALALPYAPNPQIAALTIGFLVLFGAVPYSVANAALQMVTPSHIRGTVSAIYFFAISILGSLGPSAVAFMTDEIFRDPKRLDEALSIVVAVSMLTSMLFYLLAIRPYKAAIAEHARILPKISRCSERVISPTLE